mgnify:CR=1 FL=1
MGNMKLRFEKFSKNNVLLSVLMVALGLVLFIWPGKTLTLAARILGIALLLGAAVSGFSWYREKDKAGSTFASLGIAALCLIAGLIVLIAPKGVVSLLPKLIGIAILVNGVINLAQSMELRNVGQSGWTPSMVMAVLTIALGLFLVIFSFSAMKAAVMVIGGVLVYNGVSNLWIESRYKKMGR